MNVASRMIVVVVDHPTSQRTSDQGHVDEQEKETTTTTTINDETCDESEVIFLVACDTHTHISLPLLLTTTGVHQDDDNRSDRKRGPITQQVHTGMACNLAIL